MKPILSLLAILILTMTCMAQTGINYKAVIKDNNGNVVANQSVTLQFSILKDVTQPLKYQIKTLNNRIK